jgi:hypothetical protein
MTTNRKLFVVIAIFALVGGAVFAQTAHDVTMNVSSISRLGLSSGATVVLDINTATTVGDVPDSDADASKYIQYTVVNNLSTVRRVTVQLTAGSVLAGCALTVQATEPTTVNRGDSAGLVTVDGTARNLITNINSCATGYGATDGSNLTFTLSVTNVEALDTDNTGASATLTYTITT